MHRFYVEGIPGQSAVITGGDAAHITRVLRMGVGAELEVCADGMRYSAKIISAGRDEVRVELRDGRSMESEPPVAITLYQGLPKQGKMELIVQKGVEIGVSAFVPVVFSRSVARPNGKEQSKVERWRKVAYEAAKQSGRAMVPGVEPPMGWRECLPRLGQHDLAVAAWEQAGTPLKAVLNAAAAPRTLALVIGPEGGLEPAEAAALEAAGAKLVTLGPRILRSETAGMATSAAILYHYGGWGET